MTPSSSVQGSVIFLLLPELEILDLAGPLQSFHEAVRAGADLRVLTCSPEPRVRTDQGLWLADLDPLPVPEPADLIVVPGMRFAALDAVPVPVIAWLRRAYERGAQIASARRWPLAAASRAPASSGGCGRMSMARRQEARG